MALQARTRAVALLLVAVLLGVGAAVLLLRHHGDGTRDPTAGTPPPGVAPGQRDDPLRYSPSHRADFERRGADGLAHVLYAKSPGGAVATAQRVAALRPLVEKAAGDGKVVDADTLEALVFLESAGEPEAIAGGLDGAAGLTQILAQTGSGLLGLRVDLPASRRLTRGIARGRKVAARIAARRRVDERFDPAKALAATVRYLKLAEAKLGRRDLAVESYHMGIGNLQTALRAYGKSDIPYVQLLFDSTPLHHRAAWDVIGSLGDDSSTYYLRILAAKDIMRMYRSDPSRLAHVADLQTRKNSAEDLIRPEASTPVFEDPGDVKRATDDGTLVRLPAARLRGEGIAVDPSMGALAAKVGQSPQTYRALRPDALALLEYVGRAVRAISGQPHTLLRMTSSVRDTRYQVVLAARDVEATHAYSLHTTGEAFDIARQYSSGRQAQAFQFVLDRLTALGVIAWVREPGAIHVTAGPRAGALRR